MPSLPPSPGPSNSTSSLLDAANSPSRPQMVRRDAKGNPSRRYTFAMAMTDEALPDEVLVQELEKIRAIRSWTGSSSELEDFWNIGSPSSSQPHSGSPHHDHPTPFFNENGPLNHSPEEQREDVLGAPVEPRTRASLDDSQASSADHQSGDRDGDADPNHTTPPPVPRQSFSSVPPTRNPSLLDTSDASWQAARRALLTCRECVRTERHYLAGMKSLVAEETETPPPPLMLKHAALLVESSERLLLRMEANPNVWGVASVFLDEAARLEECLVEWCSVVGEWFEGDATEVAKRDKAKSREGSPIPQLIPLPKLPGDDGPKASVRRSVSGWRKAVPPFATPSDEPSPTSSSSSSSSDDSSSASSSSSSSAATSVSSTPLSSLPSSNSCSKPTTPPTSSATNPLIAFATHPILQRKREKEKESLRMTASTSSATSSASKARRKPAVRDLAILPTQRVMRYVLLFRGKPTFRYILAALEYNTRADLSAHTPASSPSKSLVERAVDAAMQIAEKCDNAQTHSAFASLQPKPTNRSHDPPLTWSRRLTLTMSRDKESTVGTPTSDVGRSTSTVDVSSATILQSIFRPASSCSHEKPAKNTLIKPRRSSSTSAVADSIKPSGARPSARVRAQPPPSAFAGTRKRESVVIHPL